MLKRLRNNLKNKKGFTMVELIVVIVIILVLAAALVPQLLKYVDQANRANCQSEAATLLAQVQADYTAIQAQEQTGITKIDKIQDVDIQKADDYTEPDAKKATYIVGTASDSGHQTEIVGFVYNNGKYYATWRATAGTGTDEKAGWTIKKSTKTIKDSSTTPGGTGESESGNGEVENNG